MDEYLGPAKTKSDKLFLKLVKIVDILGRKAIESSNSLLFYIYEDGSVEKHLIIE